MEKLGVSLQDRISGIDKEISKLKEIISQPMYKMAEEAKPQLQKQLEALEELRTELQNVNTE